jgi:hypothetical protein
MADDPLIGMWSADYRYPPALMSDELLVFLPGRRGFWEGSNVGFSHFEVFWWDPCGIGSLRLSATASYNVTYDLTGGHQFIKEPGHFHFHELRFRIEREDTPRGKRMHVLTIDEGQDRWRRSLGGWFLSFQFGLIRHDLQSYSPPEFLSW